MEERRKMDSETKEHFAKINDTISELSCVVKEDIAYRKGLDIPLRMKTAEELLDTKASWKGLAAAISLVVVLTGIVITIAKGIR